MNTVLIEILIIEILAVTVILTPIIWLSFKVNKLTEKVKSENKCLRKLITDLRSIFKLSGEYIDILQDNFKEKIYSFVVFIGEVASYSIMRRFFTQNYKNFVIGFNIARLFW